MMKRQITYLMSGEAHLPYLVASLFTLRNHWDGLVVVYAWPESYSYVSRIAKDDRLGIDTVLREPSYRGKNAQFLDKIRLMQMLDCDTSLYLDADTTIHGKLNYLFEQAEQRGFAATQFCDWKASGNIPRKRIKRLRNYPAIDQKLIDRVLAEPWPSVNGGIFACRPESPVLRVWERWTVEAIKVFIADEAVLHLMQPLFYESNQITIICGGKFNCSPLRFQPKGLADEDVVIWHYHGDSNVRLNKSEKGHQLWWPIYRECIEKNIGGIREWRSEIKNKYMDKLEVGNG